jgi:Ca2+-binding RTX toxin-like protein
MRIDIDGAIDSFFLIDFTSDPRSSRSIEFSDGTVWDDAYIDALLPAPGQPEPPPPIAGTSQADVVYGTSGADVLSGGSGDDLLAGDEGGDTYLYADGDGFDQVEDIDTAPGNADSLVFATGITPSDVSVFARDDDFILAVGDGGVRVVGGRTAEGAIENVDFSDGTRWTISDLVARAEMLPGNRAPEMPESLGRFVADPGQFVEFVVPGDSISDPDRIDSVSLYAITADGERLPAWLQFDAVSRKLSGTPGQVDSGAHELLIIAADSSGSAAVGALTVEVGATAPVPGVAMPEPVVPMAEMPEAVSTASLAPAGSSVVGEVSSSAELPAPLGPVAPANRENAFAAAEFAAAAIETPEVFMESTEPSFRDIQHRLDVLLQTGRTNLGERYAEAIREFEERRLEREEAPHTPPAEEEIEEWNSAMHAWHDRHQGFAETELGGGDGVWGMGWGMNSPAERALGGAGVDSLSGPGSASLHVRLQGVVSAPALNEGFLHLR